ncbi:hypothetical protein ElyMa_004125700, partial [Elysia marginata]
ETCPEIATELDDKLSHFRDVTSLCTNDGYRLVNSCPSEPIETTTHGASATDASGTVPTGHDGMNPGYMQGERTGVGAVISGVDYPVSPDTGSDGGDEQDTINGTAEADDTDPKVTDSSSPTVANAANSNQTTTASEATVTRRFSDSLVVTDPATGISYTNQSIMACNLNLTRRLGLGGDPSLPPAVPIFWGRRMFVESTVAQPQQAVVIETQDATSWVDYPSAGVTPRHCAKRFQMSCFRQVEEKDCWFFDPNSMTDFCQHLRNMYGSILADGGQISGELFDQYPEDDVMDSFFPSPPRVTAPSAAGNSSHLNSSDIELQVVDFPEGSNNASCTLRNFKSGARTVRSLSFSLTMALNHETGVFVLSNENTFESNWEKVQCRMEGDNNNNFEPVCDTVYCSTGFFYAPGMDATSACLKPDYLEISFIFRGIDSATLAKILDLIQAASVYYGPGMYVEALGGFVDMERGNMAYTDMYRIQNISITDASDRIPSTLALVESLSELDLGQRIKESRVVNKVRE